jgi:hypothetical protein
LFRHVEHCSRLKTVMLLSEKSVESHIRDYPKHPFDLYENNTF